MKIYINNLIKDKEHKYHYSKDDLNITLAPCLNGFDISIIKDNAKGRLEKRICTDIDMYVKDFLDDIPRDDSMALSRSIFLINQYLSNIDTYTFPRN